MTDAEKLTEQLNPEDFRFASREAAIKDKKPETKPVGYFRDAWN